MGFNADEASFGYDAFSLLKTGKDQWGNMLPIVLKSFGDYKAPVYSYLSIPFVATLGLNVFSVRLLSVIAGTLAVYITYLLVKKLSKSENIGIIAGILLAFNPWSIMISRGAVEANLITLFLPLGIYLFLQKRYSLSALAFGINMFTYHSAKVITPVVILGLLIIFRSEILKIKFKKLILPVVLFLIFMVATFYTFKIGGGARIAERSITDGALEQGFQERVVAEAKSENKTLSKILHNKYEVILIRFTNNYLQYSSFQFLFEKGAGDGSYAMIPGIGVIYAIEGLLFVGIIPLFILKKNYRNLIGVLFLWLLITPIPAALASGVGYSGNRASSMMPVIQILEAFGAMGWYLLLSKFNKKIFWGISLIAGILFIFEVYGFAKTYFKVPNNTVLSQMDYGNLDLAVWLNQNSNGSNIILSRSLSEPQIFIAFADSWRPADFQKNTKKWTLETWVDQIPEYKLGDYIIKSVDWKKDTGGSLIAIKAGELPKSQIPIKTFYYPDESANSYVVDTTKKIYAKAY